MVADSGYGLLDATLPDEDLPVPWNRVYRMSPRAWLVCPVCRNAVHAKVSSRRLRFFAHDAVDKNCPLTGETLDHRLLKSALAAAVRQCGWYATLEARAADGSWIADVLATSPDGARQIVWEAQLARQHDDDTHDRTAKYLAAGFEVVWVFNRLTAPPAPHITVDIQERHIDVDRPIADLHTSQCPAEERCIRYPKPTHPPACPGHATWEPATASLDQFVTAVCRRQLRWFALPVVDAPTGRRPNPSRMYAWVHPAEDLRQAQLAADAVVEATAKAELDQRREQEALRHQQEQEELARQQAELARRQEEQLQQQEHLRRQREQQQLDKREEQRRLDEEQQRHDANTAALRQRQRLLTPIVVHRVTQQFGVTPWAMEEGDPELAKGITIIANSKTVAVVCPIASKITPSVADRLITVTIYVASEHERRNIARRCRPGQKIIILSGTSS